MEKKKIGGVAELAWVIGLILCPLGVCFCTKSGFGVSMIAAPTYVLFLKLSQINSLFTYGTLEYILQGCLLVLLVVILRKFKLKYLASFVTAVLYGLVLDGWYLLFGNNIYDTMAMRCVSACLGILLTTFAVSLFLRTYLPQEAYEIFVKELAEANNWPMTKVKWIFDFSFLILSISLMLILFHRFDFSIIGWNTLICTLINAPLIGMFGKLVDQFFQFNSISQKFYDGFMKIMD